MFKRLCLGLILLFTSGGICTAAKDSFDVSVMDTNQNIEQEIAHRDFSIQEISNEFAEAQIRIASLKNGQTRLFSQFNDPAIAQTDKVTIQEELEKTNDEIRSLQKTIASNREAYRSAVLEYQDFMWNQVEQSKSNQ
ncbi:MAG: hypothetical protein H6757_01340 [Candidatus Omnitrophica bacterium]|nr:hypothetical protein [Candidatus Omnitrophota bacterium]